MVTLYHIYNDKLEWIMLNDVFTLNHLHPCHHS